MTVKKRARGYSPAQQALALCETLIAGGECLDDAALLRADGAQEQLRGHAIPDPTTLGRFLASFNLGHIRQFERALEQLVCARASAARAGGGDARSRRDAGRAPRASRLAAGYARHLHRQDRLASAALLCW